MTSPTGELVHSGPPTSGPQSPLLHPLGHDGGCPTGRLLQAVARALTLNVAPSANPLHCSATDGPQELATQ
eukprot:10837609-Prorocentrum_lima.AAC.1